MDRDVPVGIVGAGPVGLASALRLASFEVASVVLEAEAHLPEQGSRACCIQGDVIEILDKVAVGKAIAAEGVEWHIGRTYVGGRLLFETTYPRNGGFSPWTNLSQYRTQQLMLERLAASTPRLAEVRWGHRVVAISQDDDGVTVTAETPTGRFDLRCQYLIAADGVHSDVRRLLDVPWTGYQHGDRFLIADIRAALPLAHERHFHFDSPSNPGRQLVMHAQPDNVWRIDWQLPDSADVDAERRNGELDQRIRQVVRDVPYEIKWLSTYRFNQRVVRRMRVGRVLLAGDAAHALPPFGARGMNSGIQDADNLAWKLAYVLSGVAGEPLLETYHIERHAAATENLRITENTIKFMVPSSRIGRLARNTLLRLAPRVKALRGRVNSGKMSEPFVYTNSPIIASRPDSPLVGQFAPDAMVLVDGRPVRLRTLFGTEFVGLYFGADAAEAGRFARLALTNGRTAVPLRLYLILPAGVTVPDLPESAQVIQEVEDVAGARHTYQVAGSRWFLVRPDSHIAAAGDGAHSRPGIADALRHSIGGPLQAAESGSR